MAELKRHMLSTVDNPFNPWDDWDNWNRWDEDAGYYSTALLARVALSSDELSEYDQDLAIETAISEIVDENTSGMFIRVPEKVGKTT